MGQEEHYHERESIAIPDSAARNAGKGRTERFPLRENSHQIALRRELHPLSSVGETAIATN
jgi:hypothetical protein